jgi:hypothetical protein
LQRELLDKGDEMQTKAAGATRDEQHSLAPIQLESTSFEHDLASIKRGEGRRLALALLGSLLAMAGLLLWMKSSDGRSAYAAAAKQLDSLYAQQRSAFPGCTLLQPQASQQVLRTVIEGASQHYGKAYEKQLAPCTRALVILERQLTAMDVPISMGHRVEGLRHATGALNRAIGRYRSYLFDPKRTYDFIEATPHIDGVVVAWNNYDVQRQKIFDALHAAMQARSLE